MIDDRHAVALLKRGNIGGLEALVKRYQVQAVRTAYLITRDRAQAEDIVQTAFLRVYHRIEQFDTSRPFGVWFMRIVVNDALKLVTRNLHTSLEDDRQGQAVSMEDLLTDPAPSPAEYAEIEETKEAIWEALGQLPPEQRAAIVLRYFLEYSEQDMAETLRCPPGTVKWRLHAARDRLKTLLTSVRLVAHEGKTDG